MQIVIVVNKVKETKRASRIIFSDMKRGKVVPCGKVYNRKKSKKVEV